jgi:phenylpyruvate tautomerase PptA (4-oxalocrotonate tautomerase family)
VSLALISPAYYLCYQSLFESKDGGLTMPHVTARVPEGRLAGNEPALIAALTDAVVQVYGEWARDLVVVHLDGIPRGRWGIGGRTADDAAPAITFGIREAALTRPGGNETAARLVAGLTDAVASVLGEPSRSGTSIELVATPEGRSAVGGTIAG